MATLNDIKARLVAQNVIAASRIFLGAGAILPPASDEAAFITLIATSGLGGTRIQNQDGKATSQPSVQVVTRAKYYTVAEATGVLALAALDGVFNTTINGKMYLSIVSRQSELADLGMDSAGKTQLAFNIDIEKQP